MRFLPVISVSLFVFLIIHFGYRGFVTTPAQLIEVDSLTYHIPIAESIASGNLLPPDLPHGLGFYPSIGETLLAVFIIFSIPLNLFNVIGIIVLFVSGYFLARKYSLGKETSIVYSFAIVSLNSVLRLANNQTIDIWLGIFFILCLILLVTPKKTVFDYLLMGLAFGLLIGVKFTGVLFATNLIFAFWREAFRNISLKKLFTFYVPVAVLGFSWYIRNYYVIGNPIYPASLLGFTGHSDFLRVYNMPLKEMAGDLSTFLYFITALNSEYLLWTLLVVLVPAYLVLQRRKPYKNEKIIKLCLLGLMNFFVFLFVHSIPGNYTSDVRYLFPSIFTLILCAFIIAKRHRFEHRLGIFTLLSSVAVFAQFSYRPKIIAVWLVVISIYLFSKSFQKIINQ